jgi:hypothetical protein
MGYLDAIMHKLHDQTRYKERLELAHFRTERHGDGGRDFKENKQNFLPQTCTSNVSTLERRLQMADMVV